VSSGCFLCLRVASFCSNTLDFKMLDRSLIGEEEALACKDGDTGAGWGVGVRGLNTELVRGIADASLDSSSSALLRRVLENDRRHLVGNLQLGVRSERIVKGD